MTLTKARDFKRDVSFDYIPLCHENLALVTRRSPRTSGPRDYFHSGDNQTEESVDPPEPLCSGDRESPQTVPPFPSPPVMPHDPSTAAAIPLTPTPDNNDLTDSTIPVPLPVS